MHNRPAAATTQGKPMKIKKRQINKAMRDLMFTHGAQTGDYEDCDRAHRYLDALQLYYPAVAAFWKQTHPYPSPEWYQKVLPEGEVWEACEHYYWKAHQRVATALSIDY
jgi:hypothetical protein